MEHALRGMLADRGIHDLPIASAGTRALVGKPLDPLFEKHLSARNVDASGFRSAQLNADILNRSAIVVTATRDHRRDVVRYDNALAERTFTLAQLSRLLSDEGLAGAPSVQSPEGLVATALAARERRPLAATEADDIEDPWQRSRRVHRRVADRLDELLMPLATRLAAGS